MPEFKAEKTEKKALDFSIIGKVYDLIRPYRLLFYFAIVITIVSSVVGPLVPYAVRYTIDEEIMLLDWNGLWYMTIGIFTLLLLQAFFMYLQSYITSFLGQNAIKLLREKVFAHIMNFKSSVFDKTAIGTLITRTVSDVERVSDIFSQGLINIIGDLLQLIIIIGFMFFMDWKLTLVVLTVFPALIISSWLFKEGVKSSFQDVRTQVSRLNAFLQEHITGMQIIKVFSREKEEMEQFEKINEKHRDANIRSIWYYSIFFPVIEILAAIAVALVIWYGAKRVLPGQIEFGALVAFIMYINMMFRPIRQIANNFNTLQMGLVASERIFKVLSFEDTISDTGTYSPEKIRGEVEFRNVWFAYNEDEYVLKDLSLTVNRGEVLAIVGATGAGKTTITNLLNRMYDINKGEILIDGRSIRDYGLKSLRKNIAIVLQDVFLFSDSISNNIRLYNETLKPGEIEEAARMIGAEKFIYQLPDNFNYQVMERGATLSAGQRQMISFLRAIIQNPSILILDEATSSVDPETEELIQKAIGVLLQGRTSIVIAHRLSTIQHADQIIVMDKGRIHERGTHQELLEKDGLYRNLIKLQFTELNV